MGETQARVIKGIEITNLQDPKKKALPMACKSNMFENKDKQMSCGTLSFDTSYVTQKHSLSTSTY